MSGIAGTRWGGIARTHLGSFACAFTLAASLTPAAGHAAAGRTAGQANVSADGQAAYSMAIFAPPGTHGMTPQLALVYGHRNPSTLVGAGWSIAGLSAITRCASNWAADAVARDIRNDYSDRFCLDGNKLRLTSAPGTYGQPGATYQTERETFSRVTSHGTAGNGPAQFIVEGQDGLTYRYGATDDSRIESLRQATVRVWALNRIADRAGNAIDFVYVEDTINGSYRISRVEYTSNSAAGLAPAYDIEFVWQTKPNSEIDVGYVAGSLVKEITRLDRIDVKYNDALVRRYELTYEAALSSTSKSRLQSVRECAGPALDCFNPTTFTYQNGVPGLNGEINTGASVPTEPLVMDVNGDGREDLVYASSTTSGAGTWRVLPANAAGGYGAEINTGVSNTNYLGAIRIDYNADGFDDLLVPYSGSTWWVMLGGAAGLGAPVNTGAPVTATGRGTNAAAFDVNGDGLDDLLWADLVGFAGGDAVRYRLREWGGTFSSTVSHLVGPLPADQMLQNPVFRPPGHVASRRVLDLNGDGRGDLLTRRTRRLFNEGSGTYQLFRSLDVLCPGAWAATVANPNASSVPLSGDFNGDGKSDLLYLNQSGGFVVRFSTGQGLTGEIPVTPLGAYARWTIIDWDGDGYDDIVFTTGGPWQLFRSTGEGFVAAGNTDVAAGTQSTVADIDGDGLMDLAGNIAGTWRYRTHAGPQPDLLQTATDGFGNAVSFNYTPITQGNYNKNSGAVFPEMDYQGPLHVVGSMSASNGAGGSYTHSFWYYHARLHLQGHGFEGFSWRRSIDSRTAIEVFENRAQLFPYTGMLQATLVTQPKGTHEISRTTNTLQQHAYGSGTEQRFLPYVLRSSTTRREIGGTYNGALVSTTTTVNSVDATSGVVYDTTTTTTEAASANGVLGGAVYTQRMQQPLAYLLNDTANWCLGRPGRIESTRSHNQSGGGAVTRTTSIDWDAAACRPSAITNEPGDGQLQVTQSLGYDSFGNVNSQTLTGAGMTARVSGAHWGTSGQFPVQVSNALSQQTTLQWDYSLGVQTREVDPNLAATSWQYDAFGRRTRETRPDGTATTWLYADCAGYGCKSAQNKMVVAEASLDANGVIISDRRLFIDQFDRPIATSARTLSGADNLLLREYDALGRVSRESAPCWSSGCTPYWTTFAYDLANRLTEVSRPVSDSDASLQTTYTYYEGLTTRVVDALGKQSTKVLNVAGGLARSIDHDNYSQSFDYDAFGNIVQVTDSLGATLLSSTYNRRGMRMEQTDLATGRWQYTPNALGEVISQIDPKLQTTTFGYDRLGRLTSRVEPEGTSTFTFGTSAAARNIGRLVSMTGPGYSENLVYDAIGRLQRRTVTADATYAIDYTYNALGALDTLAYPTSTAGYRLKLQYEYQNAMLARVRDFNAPATVFWSANDADARGNLIAETLGNGVQTLRGFDQVTGLIDFIQSGSGGAIQNLSYAWDRVGNLVQRQDLRQGLTENFYYDNLHRLANVTGPDPLTLGYDPRGNITARSSGSSASATHTISWYSYNLPNTITASTNNSSQFFYAPDRSRFKQVASYSGTSEETIYVAGLLEKVTLGATTSWKHYIAGASGAIALYTRKSNGTHELHYLTKDHLGSIDSVTSATGSVQARLSFGAFGQRRNEDTWSGNPTSGDWAAITNTTRRGFTAHEMLDNLNLTHMNGRVYDQAIGRFTSADPFIDGVGSTQGWNRYAYVHNNPLSATDPSGYQSSRGLVSWINRDLPPGMERVVVTASRGGWNTNSNPAAALHSNNVRGQATEVSGGGGGGGGGSRDGEVIEEVVTVATRINASGLLPIAAAAVTTESSTPKQKSDSCQQAEQLLAEMRSGRDSRAGGDKVIDPVDNALTAANGVLRTMARSTQGDAFLSMTSDAAERSALSSGSLPTNANTFGSAARVVGRLGFAVSVGQVYMGAREGGVAGAAYATTDAGVTSVLSRLSWPGLLAALLYNGANGSQGLVQGAAMAGQAEVLNGLMLSCAMGL